MVLQLEIVVEAERKVVAFEHDAALVGIAGSIVAATIAEEAYMGHEAEFVGKAVRDTGLDADAVCYGCVRRLAFILSLAETEIDTAVAEEAYIAIAEECVAYVGIEHHEVEFATVVVAVILTDGCADCKFLREVETNFGKNLERCLIVAGITPEANLTSYIHVLREGSESHHSHSCECKNLFHK